MKPLQWEDVQREAWHCPVLQQAVYAEQHGHVTKEEALIHVALWLSRERRAWQQREVDRLMTQPVVLRIDRAGE